MDFANVICGASRLESYPLQAHDHMPQSVIMHHSVHTCDEVTGPEAGAVPVVTTCWSSLHLPALIRCSECFVAKTLLSTHQFLNTLSRFLAIPAIDLFSAQSRPPKMSFPENTPGYHDDSTDNAHIYRVIEVSELARMAINHMTDLKDLLRVQRVCCLLNVHVRAIKKDIYRSPDPGMGKSRFVHIFGQDGH